MQGLLLLSGRFVKEMYVCVVMCVVMCVHRAVGVGAWVRSRAARAVLRLPRGAGDHAASIGPRPSIHRTSLSTAVEMNGTTIVHYTLRYVYTKKESDNLPRLVAR